MVALGVVVIVVLTAATISQAIAAPVVKAAGNSTSQAARGHCRILLVQLNGSQPSATSCVQEATQGVQPNLDEGSCGNTANLFVDAYQSGAEICFAGTGFANLTDSKYYWCDFWDCYGWNDVATSFVTHNNPAKFYQNVNGGCICAAYGTNQVGNFTWNPMPNDAVSSLCVGSCPG
jgi:hypothetical protein